MMATIILLVDWMMFNRFIYDLLVYDVEWIKLLFFKILEKKRKKYNSNLM